MIEEFELAEPIYPSFLQRLTTTLECWRWGAMHSPMFCDFYFGLNQSPIEFKFIGNGKFLTVAITFYSRIWFLHCIPFSAIQQYEEATQSDSTLIWR